MKNQNQITYNNGEEEIVQQPTHDDDDSAYSVPSYPTFTRNEDSDIHDQPTQNNLVPKLANDFEISTELPLSRPQMLLPIGNGQKRRIIDVDGEDDEPEGHINANKELHGSQLTESYMTATVHNSSKRRRCNRLNETLKALRELIPNCNKTDAVSILEDAIKYLRTLKHKAQMMIKLHSMMYPGLPYMASETTGSNMITGTNRPMMPYPLQFPAPLEHLTPAQPANLAASIFNLQHLQVPTHQNIPNFHLDQHCLRVHPSQLALSQNQTMMEQTSSEPRSFSENNKNHDDSHYSDSMDQ